MGQASVNIKVMLRERLAGALAEAALLKDLIDFIDKSTEPLSKPKTTTIREDNKYEKRCNKCRKVQIVAANRRHCPLCNASNSLKIHDG